MKLKPVITEKSLKDAKEGKYTFLVSHVFTKPTAKKLINDVFNVKVKKIGLYKMKKRQKRTITGTIKNIKAYKKIIVTLKEGKIDLFLKGDKK